MEMLLIGNGFDLEHNLPTSYRDFLDFCKKVENLYEFVDGNHQYEFQKMHLDNWKTDDSIKKTLSSAFSERKRKEDGTYTTPNNLLDELYGHIQHNIWLKYFWKCPSYTGENWIDFEMEISKVIQSFDAARFQMKYKGDITDAEKKKSNRVLSICEIAKMSVRNVLKDENSLDEFSALLNRELEKLIRALEIYIAEFINSINISKKSSDIERINPDYVLSFNYSNTYERIYGVGKNVVYDYIHGKADTNKNIENCNLVLGIDEYLDDNKKDKELLFIGFKKYYQRIYKSTENTYLDWVDKIKMDDKKHFRKQDLCRKGEKGPLCSFLGEGRRYFNMKNTDRRQHKLYIFGHSLDVTDKDVLRLLICNDNVQTKIFYYRKTNDDRTTLGKLIRNLVKIIGQDELMRRTGGAHKTIEFIPQSLSN